MGHGVENSWHTRLQVIILRANSIEDSIPLPTSTPYTIICNPNSTYSHERREQTQLFVDDEKPPMYHLRHSSLDTMIRARMSS